MKGLVIAALLVLCISSLDALTCYSCNSANESCGNPTTEQCEDSNDFCTIIEQNYPKRLLTKGCMTAKEISPLKDINGFSIHTCSTDLCN